MNRHFNAIIMREVGRKPKASIERLTEALLPDLDVLVQIDYSSLNYKDALALTGKGRICRRLPMVCGIDLAGAVLESGSDCWNKGDKVVVNGFGLSETQWGGYSQRQRLSTDWLVKLPKSITTEYAMAIGTAGYTAMLSINALRDCGVKPEDGPILVTGASGGVGSISLKLLTKLGYESVAVSGRTRMHDYLKLLGASRIIGREELVREAKPLEKETWAGAIDSVGGQTLATVLAQMNYQGVVAACGLAGGTDLPASVMPFILRGVTLRGVDSVMESQKQRTRAWNDIGKLLSPNDIKDVYTVEPMSKAIELADDLLNGKLPGGRVVIDVNA